MDTYGVRALTYMVFIFGWMARGVTKHILSARTQRRGNQWIAGRSHIGTSSVIFKRIKRPRHLPHSLDTLLLRDAQRTSVGLLLLTVFPLNTPTYIFIFTGHFRKHPDAGFTHKTSGLEYLQG